MKFDVAILPRLIWFSLGEQLHMFRFVIENELHAEHPREFPDFAIALAELRRRSETPWDQEPNKSPCQSWLTCRRAYEVIEYDDARTPCKELRRTKAWDVSAEGVQWHEAFRCD